uniref:Uncharacterized protein n=1 Tax=Anguilla anguilla TaxID=7936 RepID=A0A0E9W5T3_ANGAN
MRLQHQDSVQFAWKRTAQLV